MEHSYKIVGIVVNMDSWGLIKRQAEPYEIEYTDQPDMIVSSEKAHKLGFVSPHYNKNFAEYTNTGMSFYSELPKFDALMVHSSAVVVDGKAYLFSAVSGTGKSTHTALYRRVFGDERVRLLNDDKPALRLENGEFFAYGTPWSGKSDLNLNLRVPLGGICILRRGAKNEIGKMGRQEAMRMLLEQTIRPKDPALMMQLMQTVGKLLEKDCIWEMKCNMDPEAAIVSYEAMSGTRKEEIK